MQSALEAESRVNHMLQGVRARAGHHHLFENLRSGTLKLHASENTHHDKRQHPQAALTRRLAAGSLSSTCSSIIRPPAPHGPLRQIAKLPILSAAPRWRLERSAPKRRTRHQTPGAEYGEVQFADSYNQVWCAARTSRWACGAIASAQEWPTTLDVLVKEKLLAAVPLDPMDGQPMRYRRPRPASSSLGRVRLD